MTHQSSRGLKVMHLALLQHCTDHSLSVALWLTRRDLNLLRGDRVLTRFLLIVSRDFFSLWTWTRVQTARSTAFFNGCPYIFLIFYYITMYVCVPHFYDHDHSALNGCWSSVSIRRIIYKFLNECPFDYMVVDVSWNVGRSLPGLTTTVGWLLLLQLTVRSRLAIIV